MAKSGDGDFLGRWSRRKRGEAPDLAEPQTPEPGTAKAVIPEAEYEDQGDPEVIERLPDIDGMDDASDFTVFLQAGVPEALRRRALRKLWGVNPVLANLDGLNDYDEDYTQLHTLGRGMKTLYKVGKGFVSDDSEAPAAEAPPQSEEPAPEPPAAVESEPHMAAAEPRPAAAPAGAPTESAAKPHSTARRRRWGARDT